MSDDGRVDSPCQAEVVDLTVVAVCDICGEPAVAPLVLRSGSHHGTFPCGHYRLTQQVNLRWFEG